MTAEGWLARWHEPAAGALYLHVPFCARKCAYCDFASWATAAGDPLMGAYAAALRAQLSEARAAGLLEGCATAYVGGGTPTLLPDAELGALVAAVREAAPGVAELTCEANPDSLLDTTLRTLISAGATRLSIGVQSLDDAELAALGRLHDARAARERVAAAVGTGLDVSVDLMCAIPHQTAASWDATLEGALALGVGHVSVYPLSIEEGTPLAARVAAERQATRAAAAARASRPAADPDYPPWNDPDVQADRMLRARDVAAAHGMARYEVASHALPGHECRHNLAYWTGVPYLGLGTGAASMLTREGYERLRAVAPQLPAPPSGAERAARARLTVTSGRRHVSAHPALAEQAFDVEWLSAREVAAEDLMLGARLARGLDPALVSLAHAEREVAALARGGYLGSLGTGPDDPFFGSSGPVPNDPPTYAPTDKGWLQGNALFARLWALADGE